MIARKLVTHSIPPLRTSDTIQTVLDRMAEFRVNHLPIVNNQQFLGLITSDDLIEVADHTLPVGSLSLSAHNPFVHEWQHIYDVIRLFYEQKFNILSSIYNKLTDSEYTLGTNVNKNLLVRCSSALQN